MSDLGAHSVVEAYNRLVSYMPIPTDHKHVKRRNESSLDQASKIYERLSEESITPMAYLASCFAKHSWVRQPKFDQILSDQYWRFFEEHREDAYLWCAAIRVDVESRREVQLPIGKEIAKKALLSLEGPCGCRRSTAITGGFNPHSRLCRSCDLRGECPPYKSIEGGS